MRKGKSFGSMNGSGRFLLARRADGAGILAAEGALRGASSGWRLSIAQRGSRSDKGAALESSISIPAIG
jgi:hypothetical protein